METMLQISSSITLDLQTYRNSCNGSCSMVVKELNVTDCYFYQIQRQNIKRVMKLL